MRICFVCGVYENIGIEYLSALLKNAGHEVKLAFDPKLFNDEHIEIPIIKKILNFQEELLEEILSWNPDLIAFSVTTHNYQWACRIAYRLKEKMKDIPIIFGGPHPTLAPENVIEKPFVDILCVGEGEYPLLELADRMEKSGISECLNIPSLWFKRDGEIIKNEVWPLVQDLDSLPFADKDIFYEKSPYFSKVYSIITSRGCLYRCAYCCNTTFAQIYDGKGRFSRQRSVDNVILELTQMKKKWNFKKVHFQDDIFTLSKEWIKDFCVKYEKGIHLPFKCVVHPKHIDHEIVRCLKDAGCVNVQIGIQSLSESIRKNVLNRNGTNAELKEAMKLVKDAGIDLIVDHIFGIPYEKEEDQIKAVEIYNDIRPDMISIHWMVFFPKSPIERIAIEAGLLKKENLPGIAEGNVISYAYPSRLNYSGNLYAFQFLIGYMIILPKKLIRFVIRKHLYRYMNIKSRFFSVILPRFIRSIFWRDLFLQDQIRRHFYLIFYILFSKAFGKTRRNSLTVYK